MKSSLFQAALKRAWPAVVCSALLLIAGTNAAPQASPPTAAVVVSCDQVVGLVKKTVFGNNVIAAPHPGFSQPRRYEDYGAGLWNPKTGRPVQEVLDLAARAGVGMLRFPGGCGAHHYSWKKAVGRGRNQLLFGLDEYLRICERLGVESVITVSYFTGDEGDAADLVAYLNAPTGGGADGRSLGRAKERAANGHPEPYGVKYFEIGNEVWHGDHERIKSVGPAEYGARYAKYYGAMKAVDPTIKIGAVFQALPWGRRWNEAVLEVIRDKLDFAVLHLYPSPVPGTTAEKRARLEAMGPEEIFRDLLSPTLVAEERNLEDLRLLVKAAAGKEVPLAVTEYNGDFIQDRPVPYRHSLGTALMNAELLRIFMKPEHDVLMANYWHLCNGYWGMIYTADDYTRELGKVDYRKRPNYFVYELYHRSFGPQLLAAQVTGPPAGSEGDSSPYLTVNASKSMDNKTIYLMVVNKHLTSEVKADILLKAFIPAQAARCLILNGPRIDATNESASGAVRVSSREVPIRDHPFTLSFEPHSLTAIAIESR